MRAEQWAGALASGLAWQARRIHARALRHTKYRHVVSNSCTVDGAVIQEQAVILGYTKFSITAPNLQTPSYFPGRAIRSSGSQRGRLETLNKHSHIPTWRPRNSSRFVHLVVREICLFANNLLGNGPGRCVPIQVTESVIVSGVANISLPCIQTDPRTLHTAVAYRI